MVGTVSRIPSGTNLVASQFEDVGVTTLEDDAPTAVTGRTVVTARESNWPSSAPGRHHFSSALVRDLRAAIARGDLTVQDVHVALSSTVISNEDDIRRVLTHTIRLKHTIIALGADALQVVKRMPVDIVVGLLRRWAEDHATKPCEPAIGHAVAVSD